jgi:hypothetical protein
MVPNKIFKDILQRAISFSICKDLMPNTAKAQEEYE